MPRLNAKKLGSFRKRRWLPFSNSAIPKVSVVIPVHNERGTIASVIHQAHQVHPQTEVIIIANGSTDGTAAIARKCGAKVIDYPRPLGHDVGRAIGARLARGDIVLFTDGDIVIPARDMRMLVSAVEDGIDVALNAYTGPTAKMDVHNVVLAKHALNCAFSRFDLQGTSMTTIPHALSRKALDTIGCDNLAVPPKAHAIALRTGLLVRAVHYIDVGKSNRRRNRKKDNDPLADLIVGDHLEALFSLIQCTDKRGSKPDLERKREMVR